MKLKKTKKLMTASLALAMGAIPAVSSVGVAPMFGVLTAYAEEGDGGAEETAKTASLTVTGSDDATYTAYKLLNTTTYISEKGTTTYTYTVNPTYKAALIAGINAVVDEADKLDASSATIDDEIIAALEGFVEGTKPDDDNPTINFDSYSSEDMDKFAHAAMAVIKDLTPGEGDSYTSAKGGAFDSLAYGYYLIKEDANTSDETEESDYLIATAVTKDMSVARKVDKVPTIEKKVSFGDSTNVDAVTAKVGDEVTFTITADVPTLKKNYVIYDNMQDGLEGVSDVVVKVDGVEIHTAEVEYYKLSVKKDDTDAASLADGGDDFLKETGYTDAEAAAATMFSVSIPEADLVSGEGKVVITYKTKITTEMLADNDSTTNMVTLKYANDHKDDASYTSTEIDLNKVYTTEIQLKKWATVDGAEIGLPDTEFTLKDAAGNVIQFIQDENVAYKYTVADADAEGTKVTTVKTGEDGKLNLRGLGEGVYTLNETKPHDGFKLDDKDYKITITAAEPETVVEEDDDLTALTATIEHNGSKTDATTDATTGIVSFKVENKSGQLLPSTGGMGTYLFYGAGVVVMAGIGATFFRKKKANVEE